MYVFWVCVGGGGYDCQQRTTLLSVGWANRDACLHSHPLVRCPLLARLSLLDVLAGQSQAGWNAVLCCCACVGDKHSYVDSVRGSQHAFSRGRFLLKGAERQTDRTVDSQRKRERQTHTDRRRHTDRHTRRGRHTHRHTQTKKKKKRTEIT